MCAAVDVFYDSCGSCRSSRSQAADGPTPPGAKDGAYEMIPNILELEYNDTNGSMDVSV